MKRSRFRGPLIAYTRGMKIIAVLTTTDTIDRARAMASALVERGLAACVQISEIESVYAWQGESQSEKEYRLLIKTTEARYPDVEAAILELHSYDLPAIIAFEVTHSHGPFADWIAEQSSGL